MPIQADLTRPGMTQMQLEAASPVTPTYRAKIKKLPSFVGQLEPARRAGFARIFTGEMLPRTFSPGCPRKRQAITDGNY